MMSMRKEGHFDPKNGGEKNKNVSCRLEIGRMFVEKKESIPSECAREERS